MIDEAFVPLADLLPALLPRLPDLYDEEAGVRTQVTGYDLSTPLELSIGVSADGSVEIGGAPPLYHLQTTTQPVLHGVRLVAVRVDGAS